MYIYFFVQRKRREREEKEYERRESETEKAEQHARDMEKLGLQRTMEMQSREALTNFQPAIKQNLSMQPPNSAPPPRMLVRSTSSTLPDMTTLRRNTAGTYLHKMFLRNVSFFAGE